MKPLYIFIIIITLIFYLSSCIQDDIKLTCNSSPSLIELPTTLIYNIPTPSTNGIFTPSDNILPTPTDVIIPTPSAEEIITLSIIETPIPTDIYNKTIEINEFTYIITANIIEGMSMDLLEFILSFVSECGESEHLYIHNDVSKYFYDNNSLSCKYMVKRLEYYLSYRPYILKPVINYQQIITFLSFDINDKVIVIDLYHSQLFSYADFETNSGIMINYRITLIQKDNNYFIILLEALNDYFYECIDQLDVLDEMIKQNNEIYQNETYI